jgi:hypothetical protein
MAPQTPPLPDFDDPVWNLRRERLGNELIASGRKLIEHGSFKLSVKGTYPPLLLACGTAHAIRDLLTGKPPRKARQRELENQILATLRKLIKHTLADTFRFTVEETFPAVLLVCGTAEEIHRHIADELPRDS